MTRTFLDSGVLLTAWKGRETDRNKAIAVLEDASREFISSQMVRLELLPKSAFFKNRVETNFYQDYFKHVGSNEVLSEDLGDDAMNLGTQYGLAATNAINLASAIRQGAAEFITTELPNKPMFRVKGIRVISLHTAVTD